MKVQIGDLPVGTAIMIDKYTYYDNHDCFERRPAIIVKNDKYCVHVVKLTGSGDEKYPYSYRVPCMDNPSKKIIAIAECNNVLIINKSVYCEVLEKKIPSRDIKEILFLYHKSMKSKAAIIAKQNLDAKINKTHRHNPNNDKMELKRDFNKLIDENANPTSNHLRKNDVLNKDKVIKDLKKNFKGYER